MENLHSRQRRTFARELAATQTTAIIPSGTLKTRNADCEYRFRPDSDFWYLTGFREPDSVLVLLPGPDTDAPAEARSVLFLRDKDTQREIWTGRRLGVQAAPGALGIDQAFPIDDLWERLPELLVGRERIASRPGVDTEFDARLAELLDLLRTSVSKNVRPPLELGDCGALLHGQRLVKSEAELERMRTAASISARAHSAAMAAARPGIGENEIEALLDYHFRRSGGNGAAYTSIVAGGANACILHYIENEVPLADGDLLLIDAGAEFDYYASDVTRTFPVNGTFTPDQRALYEVVLGAQEHAIDAVRPGGTLDGVHQTALEVLVDGLIELGLLRSTRDQAIQDGSYRRFYMHKTSHWLGLDVHDCSARARREAPQTLEPGMVLTVEPGLYVADDDETVEARWRGIGIRIEDDVLVTEDGREVLTEAIPKSVDDVEAACRTGASLASIP